MSPISSRKMVPPAAAYLLTERLSRMLVLSVVLGVGSALLGYWIAHWLDASIAGAMAAVAGLLFVMSFVLSPRHGLAARLLRQRRLHEHLNGQLLLLHLREKERCLPAAQLARRFGWDESYLSKLSRRLSSEGLLGFESEGL